jgi:hypothetical protein
VPAASWIEGRAANRACETAIQVLLNGHLRPACATKHGGFGPFRLWPDLDRMASQSLVAVLAGVIDTATPHLDGNNVENTPVVSAASVHIEVDSADFVVR